MKDGTEKHKLENDLKKAEESTQKLLKLNKIILSTAGEGIYGLDLNGNTTFVNPAAAKMIGWNPDELIGLNQHEVLHHSKPDGSPYPSEKCPIYAAFKDGKVHRVDDEVFWRKDGSSFPVEYISTPMRNKSGEIEGAVVVFKDITEHKKAEEKIKSISSIPAENPNPVVRIDNIYGILYRNAAFNTLLKEAGLSEEDSFKILPDDIKALIDQVFATKQLIQYKEVNLGEKVISYNIVPVAEQEYVNLYGRDITEKKKAEEELKARTKELERINKAFVGRELKMMELKKEIEELKKKNGQA